LEAPFTVPLKINVRHASDQYETHRLKFKSFTPNENIPFSEFLSLFLHGQSVDIERIKRVNSEPVKKALDKNFDIQDSSNCESADKDDPNSNEVNEPLERNF
jgi:hypothetical protein